MKYITKKLHCSNPLLKSFKTEIDELTAVLSEQIWNPEYTVKKENKVLNHQTAYNKSFSMAFEKIGWQTQPRLSDSPRLIGDFSKGLLFGEIQFGNSSTLYRDFYKFQYGLQNGLLSLAVLIVPNDEYKFFPTRPASVNNMANYRLALRYFTVLPISVPTIIYGLLADTENVSDEMLNQGILNG